MKNILCLLVLSVLGSALMAASPSGMVDKASVAKNTETKSSETKAQGLDYPNLLEWTTDGTLALVEGALEKIPENQRKDFLEKLADFNTQLQEDPELQFTLPCTGPPCFCDYCCCGGCIDTSSGYWKRVLCY